ncbi:hypothetical protein E2C01_057427 [Portunus trituberculatus]|uniref:Uncharacterized protein n=1 Tax=Portunus trituberculatus TaxID=210409 RepID=A0A5B7H0B1_PORTR|nr:hypothetical protein [Portunus trituberculatus]
MSSCSISSFSSFTSCSGVSLVALRTAKSSTCVGSLRAAAWLSRALTVASATSPSLMTRQRSSSFSFSTSEFVTGSPPVQQHP